MNIDTVPVSFIIEPFALKHIAINVPKLPASTCFIVFPKSFISRSIWPCLYAKAMFHLPKPLSFVHCSILKDNIPAFLDCIILSVKYFVCLFRCS